LPPEGTKRRTTDELRELVKSVRSGAFHYDGRPRKSLDWASYNEAQLNEVNDMLNLIKRFVNIASARIPERPRRGGRGRPPFPARDVAKALLLQSYFGVSDRVAAGLVRLFKEKLGISNEFSYKTIERGYDPGPVAEMLQEVFRLTNELGNANETTFSVDGTGEPTSSKVNYEFMRSEQRKNDGDSSSAHALEWPSRKDFQYTVSSVGVHTKLVAGLRTTHDHSVGEVSMFPSVISQTHINCPSMATVVGDTLYATRGACSIVAGYGARPYFLPKSTAIFLSHGVPSWKEMTHELVDDPQGWLRTYHMRSISETVNSMDKTRFPWKIRRRIHHRRDAAGSLRVYIHNIRRYAYMRYIQPEFVSPIRN
jgi:transposase